MTLLFIIVLIASILFLFRLYFRRDPERIATVDQTAIIAPAEGIVDYIGTATDDFVKGLKKIEELLSGLDQSTEYTLISIFMRVWDVHVQRIPFKGTVISSKHHKGKLFPVNSFATGFLNEKTEIIIETSLGLIKVIQTAGLIARRIDTYVSEGQHCDRGDRLGMIHFGSRVTLLVPANKIKEIVCSNGQKVYAGTTVLAKA